MSNEFKDIVKEICRYYRDRGVTMSQLAEEIGISKRALQKWSSIGHRPHESSIWLLLQFLEDNNGGHFIIRLKQILGGVDIKETSTERGVFPAELSTEDIRRIRNNFPKYNDMLFLCAMIIHNNKVAAAAEVLPDGDIVQRASLISGYEVSMEKAKEVFGIDGVYDWKDKVVRYIGIKGCIPKTKDDIEILGQEALNNIIDGYLSTRRKKDEGTKKQK